MRTLKTVVLWTHFEKKKKKNIIQKNICVKKYRDDLHFQIPTLHSWKPFLPCLENIFKRLVVSSCCCLQYTLFGFLVGWILSGKIGNIEKILSTVNLSLILCTSLYSFKHKNTLSSRHASSWGVRKIKFPYNIVGNSLQDSQTTWAHVIWRDDSVSLHLVPSPRIPYLQRLGSNSSSPPAGWTWSHPLWV